MQVSLLIVGSLLVLVSILPTSWAAGADEDVNSLVDVILSHDRERLEQVLLKAEPYETFQEAYLMVKGLQVLGITDAHKKLLKNACKFVTAKPAKELRDVFYVSSIATILGKTCKLSVAELQGILENASKGTLNTQTLYYLITSMANIGMKIDDTMPATVVDALEKEDTPQSFGHAFLAVSFIPDADLSVLFDHIEDIVAQADETPSTLYFEGGLKVTSDVVNGIFALASRVNSKPVITEAQVTKFGNFLVSSKYASSLSDVVHLLTAARTLSSNEYVVPTAIALTNTRPISSSNPDLNVCLTTLMGGAVEGFTVKVKSLEAPDGEVVPRTRTMTLGKDKVTYSYPMFKDTTVPGLYKVTVSADSKEQSPVKLSSVELSVTVSFQVAVSNAKLSIVDKDQGVTTKSLSLEYPDSIKTSLQADQHSKVVMTFNLINQDTSTPVTVHQAFVRLSLDRQEIFFVATPTDEKLYSFELDVAESANDFGQLSGTYSLSLVVGDFSLENPFSWDVGSVELKFPGIPVERREDVTYESRPLIDHMFRVPEKRPPAVVSTAFTIFIFIPLVVLLIVWLVMGANLSNIMAGGAWGLLFHIGLGAILALYYCFWIQLNMFTTLKYLTGIGIFTFLSGNKMLRNIAKARQT